MADMLKIDEITFTTELVSEGSWGSRDLGKHESTMVLYLDGSRGLIEWDVPTLETTEEIGLTFEYDSEDPKSVKLVLTDYDGIFSLPMEAIELMRKNGLVVPKEFE